MSLQDPIADMLTRIRNAQQVGKDFVDVPSSKIKLAIAKVLLNEGYILDYDASNDKKPVLKIYLKYFDNKPVIDMLKRVSRPGLRIYRPCEQLPKALDGLGVAIISTSKGVMSDKEARKARLGGEILCMVW